VAEPARASRGEMRVESAVNQFPGHLGAPAPTGRAAQASTIAPNVERNGLPDIPAAPLPGSSAGISHAARKAHQPRYDEVGRVTPQGLPHIMPAVVAVNLAG